MSELKKVLMFTDGSCSGNPGPGGWGTILRYGTTEKVLSGGDFETTNNRMELSAVIEGFKALNQKCEVEVYSDSQYVCNSINNGWVYSWKKNNWKKSDKKPALNVDLWEKLLAEIEKHSVKFIWLKGHDGHPENERCDKLAVEETMKHQK